MSPAMQQSGGAPDLVGIITAEIQKARSETRPTSRQELAEAVHRQTGMSVKDAFSFVDTYCDEHEPGVPGFLQEEFAIPYLKVIAVINALLGLGICYYGIGLRHTNKPYYWWVCLGVVFFGLGVFAWVQSLERFAERRKRRSR